ncbi:hypothetical protein BaRGS_00024002 [Batillaria attramentaria]|uniref:Secreted protein n=1 Tax=Batillaria attramentaria TaxID=370345 RepID=A0ABD0KCQ8_9CAEN
MHQPWHSIVLALAACCLSAATAQAPDCLTNLYDVVATCFQSQGLTLYAHSGQQDPTTLLQEAQAMDPTIQCRHPDKYKSALACALQSLKDCVSQVGMGAALPDIDKFKQGVDVVCGKIDDFDSVCMKEHYPDILLCGQQVMERLVEKNSEDMTDIGQLLCMSTDVHYDCAGEHLKSCGKQTVDIYLEQLNKYQVPEACVDSPPGRSGRAAYDVAGTGGSNSVAASFALTFAVASLALWSRLRH